MKNDELTRRTFLSNTLSVTAAVPFLALVGAAACKDEAPAEQPKEAPPEGGTPEEAGPICDMAKVPEGEQAKRTALGYVEKTEDAAKACSACTLYVADNGAGCPGCTLFAGPVAAEGSCNSFVKKA